MGEFVEVKTADLVGPALDFSVAAAIGLKIRHGPEFIAVGDAYGYVWRKGGSHPEYSWHPSTNWAQGGPLIEGYKVRLQITTGNDWYASTDGYVYGANASGQHCLALIAACRAIVSAKLGDVVRVPAELVGDL